MTTLTEAESIARPLREALWRARPRARQTALAIAAGAVTAVVVGLASSIAGHWG